MRYDNSIGSPAAGGGSRSAVSTATATAPSYVPREEREGAREEEEGQACLWGSRPVPRRTSAPLFAGGELCKLVLRRLSAGSARLPDRVLAAGAVVGCVERVPAGMSRLRRRQGP